MHNQNSKHWICAYWVIIFKVIESKVKQEILIFKLSCADIADSVIYFWKLKGEKMIKK